MAIAVVLVPHQLGENAAFGIHVGQLGPVRAASHLPAELTRNPPPADSNHIACSGWLASHSRPRVRITPVQQQVQTRVQTLRMERGVGH